MKARTDFISFPAGASIVAIRTRYGLPVDIKSAFGNFQTGSQPPSTTNLKVSYQPARGSR